MTTNLIPNPSFEVDMTGWGGPARVAAADAKSGGFVAQAVVPAQPSTAPYANTNASRVAVDPAKAYSAGIWVRRVNADGPDRVRLLCPSYAADGSFLGSVPIDADQPLAVGEWTLLAGQGITDWFPGTAEVWPIGVYPVSNTVAVEGGLLQIDAAMFVEGDMLPEYFDGDTPDDDTYHYAWTGTPHNSTSTKSLLLKGAVHLDRTTLTEVVEDPNTEARYVVAGTSGSVGGGNGKVDALTLDGEFRSYGNGFTRLITGSGSTRTQTLALRALTPDQIEVVKALVGHKVLYRDTYGRRIFGGFLGWSITNIAFSGGLADVGLVIQTVSHDEEV